MRIVATNLLVLVLFSAARVAAQEGMLETIRQDVCGGPTNPQPDAPSSNDSDKGHRPTYDYDECDVNRQARDAAGQAVTDSVVNNGGWGFLYVPAFAAASPIWVPNTLLADHGFTGSGYFARFPYDGNGGYVGPYSSSRTKPLAVRLDVNCIETFDRLDNLGGHLLIETAPRLGFTASWNHLEEALHGNRFDSLNLGSGNIVYRFAQGEWGEFRTGLGFNWLADDRRTDFGFNFTYAADLYPRKPWILSAELNAGTLGHASLFQFRTTAGIEFHGVEAFGGYEYTDIGRTHWNGLIAGVRFWF